MHNNTVIVTNRMDILNDEHPVYQDQDIRIFSSLSESFNASILHSDHGIKVFMGAANNAAHGVTLDYSKDSQLLNIDTDKFGTEILFYHWTEQQFIVSNRLEVFKELNLKIDFASLYQYFVAGYFVGASTLFDGVRQTICSENIQFSRKGLEWGLKQSISSWVPNEEPVSNIETETARLSSALHHTTLMMSAGWDARTMLTNVEGMDVSALTHGDLSSREIEVARKISGDLRLDHLFLDTQNNQLTNAILDEMLEDLGSALFPTWYLSCQQAKKTWNRPISSGIFGELMGGHWGVDKLLGTRTRASSILKFVIPGYKPDISFDEFIGKMAPSKDLWYLTDDAKKLIFNSTETLQNRIEEEVSSYKEEDIDLAVEQFMAKHKARQYLLKQAHCSKNSIGYVLPYTNEELTNCVLSFPFEQRVHNKLNLKVVKQLNRKLLSYPTAAILCAASRPVVIQECTRVVRLLIEKITGKNNYGWFNYDFLVESKLFDEAIESLRSEIWDKEAMKGNIAKMQSNKEVLQLGYTLDTICKVKTIDHLLSN